MTPNNTKSPVNLAGKVFRAVSNSKNGHLDSETEMRFTADDGIVVGTYSGGAIVVGHVLAKRTSASELEMLYHGANRDGVQSAGTAHATFSPDSEGRLHMYLNWQWLTGDRSKGQSEWILIGGI